MRVALYPGSFDPWHDGHEDILNKALRAFDKVIICVGFNPDKSDAVVDRINGIPEHIHINPRVEVHSHVGLMADYVNQLLIDQVPVSAMVRGIRNAQDMEYERVTQYYNEDLGCTIPTTYFICDRKLVHVSSSAIKVLQKLGVR
jgi:pantetheine-phosphate adenylyltransferase